MLTGLYTFCILETDPMIVAFLPKATYSRETIPLTVWPYSGLVDGTWPQTSAETLVMEDDDMSITRALPFKFQLFGEVFEVIQVLSNGFCNLLHPDQVLVASTTADRFIRDTPPYSDYPFISFFARCGTI